MRLRVDTIGHGPDLVLLHGWGMNKAVWSPLVAELSQRHRLSLMELPGHGANAFDYTNTGLDAWVRACLDTAPEHAVWMGWSLGGMLAQRAAVLAPERVHALVAVASTPRFVTAPDWPHAMPEATLKQFARSLVADHRQTLERFLALQVKGDEQTRQTLRQMREDIALRPAPDPAALEQGLELLLTVDLRDQLAAIRCPTLWLLGERDTLVPVEVGEAIETLMPDAEVLILSGCAHAPFLSHPRESLEVLDHFLEAEDV